MCTCIAKRTSTKLVMLTGLPCCLSVEEVQEHYPSISRDRGWQEELPSCHAEDEDSGKKFVPLELDDEGRAILRRLGGVTRRTVVASFTFRGTTIRFNSRDHILVLREYVASRLRKPRCFPGYELYLRNIPSGLLRRSQRRIVVKRLDAILRHT